MDKPEQAPDEIRDFPRGRAEILNVGGGQCRSADLPAGVALPADVKPIAGNYAG
jgi:hypothetical protein